MIGLIQFNNPWPLLILAMNHTLTFTTEPHTEALDTATSATIVHPRWKLNVNWNIPTYYTEAMEEQAFFCFQCSLFGFNYNLEDLLKDIYSFLYYFKFFTLFMFQWVVVHTAPPFRRFDTGLKCNFDDLNLPYIRLLLLLTPTRKQDLVRCILTTDATLATRNSHLWRQNTNFHTTSRYSSWTEPGPSSSYQIDQFSSPIR